MKVRASLLAVPLLAVVLSGCEFFSKKSSSTESNTATSAQSDNAPSAGDEAGVTTATITTTPKKLSCICKCEGDLNGKKVDICSHFNRVDGGAGGEAKFECDTVFQVMSDLPSCEETQKSPTYQSCIGFNPESKAGGFQGVIKDCRQG